VQARSDLAESRTVGGETGDGSAEHRPHDPLIVPYFSRQTSRRRPLRSPTDIRGDVTMRLEDVRI
jgi:hypothetical protein